MCPPPLCYWNTKKPGWDILTFKSSALCGHGFELSTVNKKALFMDISYLAAKSHENNSY